MKKKKTPELKFVNAQAMAKRYPETFQVPTKAELDAIKPSDSVKVCIKNERFWVTVHAVTADIITGAVDNELIWLPLSLGQVIKFEKKHVHSIIISKHK